MNSSSKDNTLIKKFLFDRKKIKLCQWCAHRWTLKDSYDTWDPYCPVSSMHLARDQKTLKCYWWRLWSNPLIDIFNILHHHIKFINPLQPPDSKQKFHKIRPFPSNTIYKKIPPTKNRKTHCFLVCIECILELPWMLCHLSLQAGIWNYISIIILPI